MSESRPALIRIRGLADGQMVVELLDQNDAVLASPYVFAPLEPDQTKTVATFDESFTIQRVLL